MTTEETTTEETTHQPTLPSMELPEYHGRAPVGMKTALNGAGTRITRAHSIGDRVVLIIEGRVKAASHEDTDDGLVYAEKIKVLDVFELDGDQGARLLTTIRSLHRSGEDALKGRQAVPGLGEVGYTDASGVVLTPDEVAELRGDPIRALLTPGLTPAVVVYEGGERDLWPDDYPRDPERPKPGDRFLTEGGESLVVALLHHETGETIATLDEYTDPAGDVPVAPANLSPHIGVDPVTEDPAADFDLPDDGDPDPFDGDLGDDATGWEPETPPRPLTADEVAAARSTEEIEALLPTAADFAFVDCQIPELTNKLRSVTDLTHARRLQLAEKQGRGRGLLPRAGAMKAVGFLVAKLEAQEANP